MKKITLCLFLFFLAFSSYAQIVVSSSSPYFENFESGAGGWASAGGFPNEWQLGTPDPSATEINASAPGGSKSWKTDLGDGVAPSDGDGLYANAVGAAAYYYLNSPVFNFSAVTTQPTVSLDFWCDLEFSSSWFYDGAWLEYRVNGGAWSPVGSSTSGGTNWYTAEIETGTTDGWSGSNDNNDTDGVWEPIDGESSQGWRSASHMLPCNVIGAASVEFRFVVAVDNTGNFDGFAIDNFGISSGAPSPNIAVSAVPTPISGVNLTAAETLTVTVENVGNSDISSLTFNVNITGPVNSSFSETIAVSIPACPPSGPTNVTLTTPIDMSLFGYYTITVTANLPGDIDTGDNSISVIRENRKRVTAFPYTENFDGTTNTGWYIVPTSQVGATRWNLANPPANTFINSAASPTRAWVTTASGNYTAGSTTVLISPIFDLSTFNAGSKGILSFDRIFDIAKDGDRVQVVYTTNPNAVPNTNLDDAAWTGANWHNLPNGFDGLKQGWKPSRELLTQVFGQANVRFAFIFASNNITTTDGEGAGIDNIFIGKSGLTDLAVAQLTSPATGANKILPQTVSVRLDNVGAGAVSGATMKYKISGPNGVQTATQNVTFGTPIATGNSSTFTFATQANLSFVGTYQFEVTAEVTGDLYNPSNTGTATTGTATGDGHLSFAVVHEALVPLCGKFPENFSTASGSTPPAGWSQNTYTGDAADTWRFNNPAPRATPIGMTAPFAIFDSDNYSDNGLLEDVALNSNSMDFSNISTATLRFKYWFYNGFNGKGYVEATNNGGATWNKLANLGTGATGGTTLPTQGAVSGTSTAPTASLSISNIAGGQADFRYRFRWTGDYSWYWMVDNIEFCLPEQPASLTAEGGYRKVVNAYVDSVKIQWEDLILNENGFILQRATDTAGIGNWEVIAGITELPADTTSYIDRAVFANTRYFYRVQYSYSGGLSDYSNLASAIIEREDNPTPAYQPVLTAKADYQKAYLTWTKPLDAHNIAKFEVYFGIEVDGVPSNPNVRIALTEDTKFTAIGLVNGFNYSFIVKPVLADGKYYQNLTNIAYARPSVILDAEELSKQFNFNVYPNPNDGNFTLALEGKQSEKLNVRVVNVAGQEVYAKNFGFFNGNMSETIDLSSVSSGLYIVIVETDGGMIQRKVSINK